jgi:hypothetical protein
MLDVSIATYVHPLICLTWYFFKYMEHWGIYWYILNMCLSLLTIWGHYQRSLSLLHPISSSSDAQDRTRLDPQKHYSLIAIIFLKWHQTLNLTKGHQLLDHLNPLIWAFIFEDYKKREYLESKVLFVWSTKNSNLISFVFSLLDSSILLMILPLKIGTEVAFSAQMEINHRMIRKTNLRRFFKLFWLNNKYYHNLLHREDYQHYHIPFTISRIGSCNSTSVHDGV